MKREGKCPPDTIHRQIKYVNNVIEADHGKLIRVFKPNAWVQVERDGLHNAAKVLTQREVKSL
ncbi:hypothetical protein GCM10007094_00360 [Pseudovibrio japonicus]|uniref:DDE domain-containing protein n=1 Tax=Pseudovibrio japonicus TaxID=366534 RepID=A0ABQ3E024_9HYPH|nr:hypothetical protein GCM10007094_00360 [Pseudovibrio japonicus]